MTHFLACTLLSKICWGGGQLNHLGEAENGWRIDEEGWGIGDGDKGRVGAICVPLPHSLWALELHTSAWGVQSLPPPLSIQSLQFLVQLYNLVKGPHLGDLEQDGMNKENFKCLKIELWGWVGQFNFLNYN